MSAVPAPPPSLVTISPHVRKALMCVCTLGVACLVVGIARSGVYTAQSLLGYWMGVVGGSFMLVLLLYPLSKRARAMREFMPVRYWFALHMFMGIFGPVLVIMHSTLRLNSFNAAVAFWSMVIVASSGLVGRFVYGRLHAGLYGRQRSFAEVAKAAENTLNNAAAQLAQAPEVMAELRQFAAHANAVARAGLRRPFAFFLLNRHARQCAARCALLLAVTSRSVVGVHAAAIDRAVVAYLQTARDAAQFRAFERVFALWHVLHIPLVWLLVVSAVFHVIAVHMY
jgi:hypothetical protein